MCLGIPGRIVAITDPENYLAKVDVSGVQRTISVRLLERDMPEPDEWVLVHVGFAMAKIDETEALLTLIFDTLQLALLLFLTGGLNNPFALLLIAPVTIAATALQTRATLILGLIAVALASFLALVFEPLHLADGAPLLLPDIFRFGFWLAVVVGMSASSVTRT